jgi:beta-N-acetylhexosaminidase
LEEKVGQLFMLVDLPNKKEKIDLLSIKPGGVHVFAFGPHATKEHQQTLIRGLQQRSALPLLISGDLESGGKGGASNGTNFATNMQLAAANDPHLAEAFGEGIEAEGTAIGFNWVYGPVMDINYNFQNPIVNTRAFGDTQDVVTQNALPVINGIQKNRRMAACVKHWPGDGLDDRDQHKVLSVNSMSMEKWRETFGKVYKKAIEAGVMTVMSAHIALPAYYEELGITDVQKRHTPGSLSYELNTKLLREELGFNGLIVSDATPKEAGGLFTWYPTRVPTVFISLGNPYTLYEMPSMQTLINAYNGTAAVQREIVHCLVGRQPFLGVSPVDAFCGQEWSKL